MYVGLTAVLAVAAAIWAIPTAFQGDGYFGWYAFAPGQDGPPLPSLSPSLQLFPFSAQIVLLAVGVGLLVQIYSTAYLGRHRRYRSYALIIVLFLLAMIAVVGTTNLWVLLVGWEVMGVCSYLLIGHEWETGLARAGAAKAFLMTRVADLGLVLAILVIGETYGTYDIMGAQTSIEDAPQNSTAIGLLILIAVVGKSAQFPLHTWLPDAMPGPTPITALIHAATMVAAGVYLAATMLPFYADSVVVMTSMAVIAAITMLLGALFALVQTDLKRALAWSTVSQLAFMFAAIAASDPGAGLDHLVSHGVFKALLFLGCGCMMHAVGSSALSAMGGLRTSMPTTFWSMTAGFAALAGVIPTVGFFTKDSVLHGLHSATDGNSPLAAGTAWALLVVALVTSFVTAAYATRLWLKAFFGPASQGSVLREQAPHDAAWPMTLPVVLLAVVTFALSVGQPFHLDFAVLSTAISLAGVGVVVGLWRRGAQLDWAPQALTDELHLDRPYSRWLPRSVNAIVKVVIEIDRDGVAVYPRASGAGAGLASQALERVQSRNVQRYATIIAVGVIVLVGAGVIWS